MRPSCLIAVVALAGNGALAADPAPAAPAAPRVITNDDLPKAPHVSVLGTPAATSVPDDLAKRIHDEYRQAEQDQAARPLPPQPEPPRTWSDDHYVMAWPWSSWGWRQSFTPSCPGCPQPRGGQGHGQRFEPGRDHRGGGGNHARGGAGHASSPRR